MKRLMICGACAAVLLWIGGCQGQREGGSGKTPLPPEVAGAWQGRDTLWKIVLNPDGTVSSAHVDMGDVDVRPNQTSKVQMKDGQFSTYKAGDCIVEYTPATRELYVSVEMESIHVVYLDNVIDGNSLDRFVGPVSEDGKTWIADWIKVFDYGPRFPQDPNDAFNGPVTFEKIGD